MTKEYIFERTLPVLKKDFELELRGIREVTGADFYA